VRDVCRQGLQLAESELGSGGKVVGGEVLSEKLGPRGSGDHGGIVGRESERGKGDGEAAAVSFGLEAAAEFAVGRYSAGDDDGAGSERFGGGEGLALKVADDGVLEGRDEVEGLLVAELGRVFRGDGGISCESRAACFDAVV
jgi:hypothetical protein